MWGKSYFVCHMSIPSFRGLWLICPDLVLVSLLIKLELFLWSWLLGCCQLWCSPVGHCRQPACHCPPGSAWWGSYMISFFPLSLIIVFPWSTHALESGVHDLGILFCSSGTVYIKSSLIIHFPSLYVPVCTYVSHVLFYYSACFSSLWWWRIALSGHCC